MRKSKETYLQGLHLMEAANVEDAGFDCLQLFAHYTGFDRGRLIADGEAPLTEEQVNSFLQGAERRCKGEPLQYILGEWEFYSLPFVVGEGVLIPRADTEILVDEALRLIEDVNQPKVADLCAGSGCIGISIAKNRPDATVTAVEFSDQAIGYLQQNIARNQVDNVTLQQGDVLLGAGEMTGLDLIVSNPPYIPTADIKGLSREVHHEPAMALDGGEDGLVFYRSILETWTRALNPNGMIAFEVGINQAEDVANLMAGYFEQIYIVPDLNQVPRVVLGLDIIKVN
ncbi:MAG: peptide chain release factor N(5)-glutamine methyltransferase [Clostridia bacterium]|nr:peptide chain release factor N(5)-glutamine methyltransferase [Clostridia bacterium]